MELFNRVVVILFLLALIPIFTVGLIVPREAIQLLRDGLDQIEGQLAPSVSTKQLLISGGLALLIDGLLVFLLYLQVRRPAVRAVPVQQVEGGQAQIVVSSIVDRLEYHIDRLPGVLKVKPRIITHRRGVEVVLEVETVADVNVRAAIEEISALTRRVVEDEMGLKLKGKPKLSLRAVTYPEPAVKRPQGALAPGETVVPGVKVDGDESVLTEVEGPGLSVVGDEAGVGEGNESGNT
jgi:hypothetical protein